MGLGAVACRRGACVHGMCQALWGGTVYLHAREAPTGAAEQSGSSAIAGSDSSTTGTGTGDRSADTWQLLLLRKQVVEVFLGVRYPLSRSLAR